MEYVHQINGKNNILIISTIGQLLGVIAYHDEDRLEDFLSKMKFKVMKVN